MRCGKIQPLIEAYADDALAERQRRQVEAHLDACPQCAAYLRQCRQLAGLLGGLPEEQVSNSFEPALRERLAAGAPPSLWRSWWARFQLRSWRLRRPAYASALAATVLALALIAPRALHHPPASPGDSAPPQIVQAYVQEYGLLAGAGAMQTAQDPPDYEALDASLEANFGDDVLE